ncbi:MAG: RnfABCDGE type electron transport complex subunit B [Oscillospiraceae bacterium]|jgi:Na+-translocating ferredoxin:NAD+ oxidoreductase RNF subunit RnfB|nr:RnfABCDGE type electron transport complex subunit B [Oscillospiraceae bacterium]
MSNTIITAMISVTAIGFICAIVLAIASKVMSVKVDERVASIRAGLPGANCGACGFSGCDGYAVALVNEGAKTNLCTPGGDAVSKAISTILGVDFEDVIEQVAVVHCRGDGKSRQRKMQYSGIRTCSAAKQIFGGQNACVFGCLGFGDCAEVCPNDAICIEDGLARIDSRKCSGCGLCAKNCPNGVIFSEADTITTVITCVNTEKGAVVRKKCTCGCIACMKCVKECPAEAIKITGNLARIDYDKCTGCGKCAEICVTNCIQQANFSGIFKN